MQYTPQQLSRAYLNACLLELEALKPGNVHIFADGHGMTVQDFIKSAEVSSQVMALPDLTVGERILKSVEATQKAVGCNTNLGIVLLCAPLLHAALHCAVGQSVRQSLAHTLQCLTVADANLTAQAIVLANPAGLGSATTHDVHQPMQATLLEMMQTASEKDAIAQQYGNGFADVFEFGLSSYQQAMQKWLNPAWSATALYLSWLACQPDSHVVRKYGVAHAKALQQQAKSYDQIFWESERPKLVQARLLLWDGELKQQKINPGTTADLVVTTLVLHSLLCAR